MKKILHVIDALNVGGAQELLDLMAKHSGGSFAMSVCVLQPVLDLKEKIESRGVTVHALNRARASILHPIDFMRYAFGCLFDILRICRAERIDIVHAHLSDAEFLCYFVRLLGCAEKYCVTVHTPWLLPEKIGFGLRVLARKVLLRVVYAKADKVIAVSRNIATVVVERYGVDPAKLVTIVNGVDIQALAGRRPAMGRDSLGLLDGQPVLLCVGRLTPQKGHRHLLEAMRLLGDRIPGARLLLAGDGELREELAAMARTMGVADRAVFLGSRSDVPDLLALSDVYVCASVFEGTSLAMMEAMAAGKPIVATDIPGNTELLENGVTALLVPPADAPALAAGLARLIETPGLALELAGRARETARKEFAIEVVVRNYLDAWGIASPPEPGPTGQPSGTAL